MTKKQRAAVEKFKWGGPKIHETEKHEARKPSTSWWVEGDFAKRAKEEAGRMNNSTFGRTPSQKLAD